MPQKEVSTRPRSTSEHLSAHNHIRNQERWLVSVETHSAQFTWRYFQGTVLKKEELASGDGQLNSLTRMLSELLSHDYWLPLLLAKCVVSEEESVYLMRGFCQCVHKKKKKSLNSQTSIAEQELYTHTHPHLILWALYRYKKKLSAVCCDNLTFIPISTSQMGSVQKQMRILCPGVATATLSFRNYWLINLPLRALSVLSDS